ncbi:MAG: gas vesicle protein [Myxococcales bacterium]|nr:gas vesicle protein [Myxococcales bacterium]
MSDRHEPGLDDDLEIARGYDDAERERVSLCEVLDRVLHKGVIVRGELVISVADVDLLYLGLQVVLASTDTAIAAGLVAPRRRWVLNPPMIRD